MKFKDVVEGDSYWQGVSADAQVLTVIRKFAKGDPDNPYDRAWLRVREPDGRIRDTTASQLTPEADWRAHQSWMAERETRWQQLADQIDAALGTGSVWRISSFRTRLLFDCDQTGRLQKRLAVTLLKPADVRKIAALPSYDNNLPYHDHPRPRLARTIGSRIRRSLGYGRVSVSMLCGQDKPDDRTVAVIQFSDDELLAFVDRVTGGSVTDEQQRLDLLDLLR